MFALRRNRFAGPYLFFLSLFAPTEVGAVTGKIFVFLGCIFAAKELVAVRKAAKLLNDVVMQLRKLCNGFEGFPVGRRDDFGQAAEYLYRLRLHL